MRLALFFLWGGEMKIILTECDTGNFMTFSMLPEEIKVDCATRFQSYDIMNIGESYYEI